MTLESLRPYDDIRPFEPEELQEAFDRITQDSQFRQVLAWIWPGVPAEAIREKMRGCRTNLDFQKTFCYGFILDLLKKTSKGCDLDNAAIDITHRHTFVSNHRDIVLDSALLDVMLIKNGSDTTVEIAIGDNLLSLPWVKDLVRINKSFIVRRGLPMRQMLQASKLMAEYMHTVISHKNDNIWIAQREGRAKDSNDRTQEAILKMMAMGGTGSAKDRLSALRIVPLAISYEYDPCDYLKAREFQLRRDVQGWKKGPTDDITSMQTGIMGHKGRIHLHCAPCINDWMDTLPQDMPKTDFFAAVASHIDSEIFRNYRLYPCNYAAIDMLHGTHDHADRYTDDERNAFDDYVEGQIARIEDLPSPDHDFLRERILTMYANPALNHLSAINPQP